jgi:hypothetical protein
MNVEASEIKKIISGKQIINADVKRPPVVDFVTNTPFLFSTSYTVRELSSFPCGLIL